MPLEANVRVAERSAKEVMRQMLFLSLADDVREHELFKWIGSFDVELGQRDSRESSGPRGWSRLAIALSRRSAPPDLLREALEPIVAQIVSSILQRSYGTAIMIGQEWDAATTRIQWLAAAREPSNLALTIAANSDSISAQSKTTRRPEDVFVGVFDEAQRLAETRLTDAQNEWKQWIRDTSFLREQLELIRNQDYSDTDDAPDSTVALLVLQLLLLRSTFSSSETNVDFPPSAILLPLLARQGAIHPRDLSEVLYYLDRFERESVFRDAKRLRLLVLEERYGTDNPFEEYVPLGRSADAALANLIEQHLLPDGEFSHYARSWLDSLLFVPSDPSRLDSAAEDELPAWADSELKRHLTRRKLAGLQDINSTLRESFIDWLRELKTLAKTRAAPVDVAWSFDKFSTVANQVWRRLKQQGYKFEAVSEDLLKKIWES